MKSIITFLVLVPTSFSYATSVDFNDLLKTSCTAYEDVNSDPVYSFDFYADKDDDSGVRVVMKEKVASRIFKDEFWVTIYKSTEQSVSSKKFYSMGVDDVVVTISREESKPGKPSGEAVLRIGRSEKKLDLYCDKK